MKIALRDWLQAVSQRVPVWSGMARSSLFAVAQLAGGNLLLSPLKGASRIAAGRRAGTATIVKEGNSVVFTFSSTVLHYIEQEDSNVGVSRSAPWQSLKAGEDAFVLSISKLTRLPALKIKIKQTRVS